MCIVGVDLQTIKSTCCRKLRTSLLRKAVDPLFKVWVCVRVREEAKPQLEPGRILIEDKDSQMSYDVTMRV
jgi:hypothetical protein